MEQQRDSTSNSAMNQFVFDGLTNGAFGCIATLLVRAFVLLERAQTVEEMLIVSGLDETFQTLSFTHTQNSKEPNMTHNRVNLFIGHIVSILNGIDA